MAGRRVTSFDVAEAAGVSRTTVSFVLNDVQNQTIPDKTRIAVLDAARRLGYTPSAAARALRAGSSQLVLVLGSTYQPSELMDAGMLELTRRLRLAGYATVIAMSASDADSLDVLWQSVSPAAIVAMFDMPVRIRDTIKAMHIPVIDALFHTAPSMPGQFELQVDVGRQQAEYLVSRGATHLAFAHPPQDGVDDSIHDDRCRGVREVADAHGLPFAMLEVPWSENEPPSVIASFLEQFVGAQRVDGGSQHGICAYNDLTALVVLKSAHHIGLRAPEDFLIIGVDDIAAARYTSPTLTSVRFEIVDHIGAIASRVTQTLAGADSSPADTQPLSHVVPRESA